MTAQQKTHPRCFFLAVLFGCCSLITGKNIWMVNFSVYLPTADGSGRRFQLLAPAVGPQKRASMGDISVIDAARRLVGARGSPSCRNRHSADAPITTEEGKPRRLSTSVLLQNILPHSPFNFQDVLLFFRPPALMLVRGHADCFKAESRRRARLERPPPSSGPSIPVRQTLCAEETAKPSQNVR